MNVALQVHQLLSDPKTHQYYTVLLHTVQAWGHEGEWIGTLLLLLSVISFGLGGILWRKHRALKAKDPYNDRDVGAFMMGLLGGLVAGTGVALIIHGTMLIQNPQYDALHMLISSHIQSVLRVQYFSGN